MLRTEITATDEQFIKENYGVILSKDIPKKLGLRMSVYFEYIRKQGLKNNRQKKARKDKPEYHFCWDRAKVQDFIFGNIHDNYQK